MKKFGSTQYDRGNVDLHGDRQGFELLLAGLKFDRKEAPAASAKAGPRMYGLPWAYACPRKAIRVRALGSARRVVFEAVRKKVMTSVGKGTDKLQVSRSDRAL